MFEGANFIGFERSAKGDKKIKVFSTVKRETLDGEFFAATDDEIDDAVAKAKDAFKQMKKIVDLDRAQFLEAIADEIEQHAEENIKMAMEESGLPEGRLKGETGRTVGQLRFFAQIIKEGSYTQSTIDTAEPDRKPVAKPGMRTRNMPLGPVAIFAASNFPFAFSTAGGDTVSALAAGCPVIVKAHPAHLGTNELISACISRAAKRTNMPDGIFSSLNGDGPELGIKLAKHPGIKAIGFTGSRKAGLALAKIAIERETPIPVYAEMSSVNPVVILPGLLIAHAQQTAEKIAGSITLGAGQFCTNPGLLFCINDENTSSFISMLQKALACTAPQVMLNKGIAENFYSLKKEMNHQGEMETLVLEEDPKEEFKAAPALHKTSAKAFIKNKKMQQEIFGPSSIVVVAENKDELIAALESLEGQLTATIFANENELSPYTEVMDVLTEKVGRIIFNNVPTGVEVSYAMIHGGPYPATTDARSTSVGGEAIKRFLRPVCFQGFPNDVLPNGLKDENPNHILRKVDGKYNTESL